MGLLTGYLDAVNAIRKAATNPAVVGGAAAGLTLSSDDAEAGLVDDGLKAVRAVHDARVRHMGEERAVERGVREVLDTTARLTKAEKDAVKAGVDASGHGTYKDALEAARKLKARFPNKGVETPWEAFDITGMEVSKSRSGAFSYKPTTSASAYKFNMDPSTGKAATNQSQHFQSMVDAVANEIIAIARQAENGDPSAMKIMDNAGWYRNVEARGFNEYGSFYDMFGDLLGATSPNTPVATNFRFSQEILHRATKGDFDDQMDAFADVMDQVDDLTRANNGMIDAARAGEGTTIKAVKSSDEYVANEAKIKELKGQVEQIRQESGKLYGMNSTNAMIALADRWRIFRKGDAPKAKNFSGNLVGYSIKPTIDVWSARNLRRHAGLNPIPSPAETGVSGKIIDPDEFTNSQEFGFGQEVLTAASERVNEVLGIDIEPRDMQALQWFAEKDHWSRRGWTSVQGEGGSFETMMDQSPVESLIAGTSRSQSMEYQGRAFNPGPDDQLEMADRFMDAARNDPDVVASKAPTTQGLYGSDVETSFDVDIVSKRDMLPVDTLDQIAIQAVGDAQDSFFVARRIEPALAKENPAAFQVGMEAYFKTPVAADGETITDLQKHLNARGVQGFTLIVDPRKPAGAMADDVIGVRFIDIPQFYDAESFARMGDAEYAAHASRMQDEYQQIGNDLKDVFGEIRTAEPSFFDVNVKSKGEAADYVAQLQARPREADSLRKSFWGYRPATARFKEWHGATSKADTPPGAGSSSHGFGSPGLLAGIAAGTTAAIATLQPQDQFTERFPDQGDITIGPAGSIEGPAEIDPVLFTAVSDYQKRRFEKTEFWDTVKAETSEVLGDGISGLLKGVNFVGSAIDLPFRRGHGLANMLGNLAEGESFDVSLNRGANVARQPLDVTGKQLGKFVADETGSAPAAAVTDAVTNVGSPW